MNKFLAAFSCMALFASPCLAEPCAELVRECFAYTKLERTSCFYASAHHSFCATSKLGRLAMKRWEMSPEQDPGLEAAPALMGPRLIDSQCLQRFDTQLASALANDTLASKAMLSLEEVLNSCIKTTADGLMRP